MTDRTINLKIPEELAKELEKLKKEQDRSISSMARLSLERYVKEVENARPN